ncbi:SRPBCC family protein [Pseudonocardia sp. RS11V-5]|uniref:SRPBCC family protein n=1 Tax=Pseudonocardia terrae TaxID=2905831 RepID=UPI001E2C462D|nr:SRPBCC family protein [Pseudonocardia terrae]MCE3553106.1 SRPBCC family protein [Pseudonocardia terrae]
MPDTSKLAEALPSDALKDAGSKLLSMLVQRAAEAATDRVTSLTDRLDTVTENGGSGLREALGRGRDDDADDDADSDEDGDGGGKKGGGFFSGLKEKVGGLFGGGGDDSEGGGGGSGGGKKVKLINIVEEQDVGLPVRTTYNLWTQYADFPGFMKKVESVDQIADEKTHWKAQIFLSHREWEATTMEQVADSHVMWRSKGVKGHVDGAVSFTELGPNLTRILLVLEYHPQGLFERTGNIWRAQGRRARLEFKHFRRHAMTTAMLHQDEIEGWRGEIRDGEVVRTHEEALEDERRAREEEGEPEERDEYAEDYGDEGDEGDEGEPAAEYDEDYDEEEAPEGETEEAPADEADEYDEEEPEDYDEADEADEYSDEEPDEEYEESDEADTAGEEDRDRDTGRDTDEDTEPDEEPRPARRRTARRQPAGAGGRSR